MRHPFPEYTSADDVAIRPDGPQTRPRFGVEGMRRLRAAAAVDRWLTIVAVAMVVTALVTAIAIVIDPHHITGEREWIKPTRFAVSIAIYCFTILWLLRFVKGHRWLVALTARAIGISLVVEEVIIAAQVLRGTTSHFNFSSILNETLFLIMGSFIVVVWIMTLVVAIVLLRQRIADAVVALSVRLGLAISLVGSALGAVMVIPNVAQRRALEVGAHLSVVGAHTVGARDGGPGLPVVGWSTVGGDLRVAHLVGLHALQVLPLLGWALSRARLRTYLDTAERVALLWISGIAYLAVVATLEWQALRGESFIHPGALTLSCLALILGTAGASVGVVIVPKRRESSAASS